MAETDPQEILAQARRYAEDLTLFEGRHFIVPEEVVEQASGLGEEEISTSEEAFMMVFHFKVTIVDTPAVTIIVVSTQVNIILVMVMSLPMVTTLLLSRCHLLQQEPASFQPRSGDAGGRIQRKLSITPVLIAAKPTQNLRI